LGKWENTPGAYCAEAGETSVCDYLAALGYVMSDEERALYDGTSELYVAATEEDDYGEDGE